MTTTAPDPDAVAEDVDEVDVAVPEVVDEVDVTVPEVVEEVDVAVPEVVEEVVEAVVDDVDVEAVEDEAAVVDVEDCDVVEDDDPLGGFDGGGGAPPIVTVHVLTSRMASLPCTSLIGVSTTTHVSVTGPAGLQEDPSYFATHKGQIPTHVLVVWTVVTDWGAWRARSGAALTGMDSSKNEWRRTRRAKRSRCRYENMANLENG